MNYVIFHYKIKGFFMEENWPILLGAVLATFVWYLIGFRAKKDTKDKKVKKDKK